MTIYRIKIGIFMRIHFSFSIENFQYFSCYMLRKDLYKTSLYPRLTIINHIKIYIDIIYLI